MPLNQDSTVVTQAPVLVFCYRRPDHLRQTLTSLKRCDGFEHSPVIVYCDGPRTAEEISAVEETRATAKTLLGDRAEYHFSDINQGLAKSVISGVNGVVARFGRVIVVEDDLELAPAFLTSMNEALERFAEDTAVYQVSGYMFDVPELKSRSDAVLLPMTVSWGWATWKRAWDQFDPLATGWEQLEKDSKLSNQFNLEGAYDYATMLKRQMTGQLDSWAIRWYWSVFKANGLVLFPPATLVRNHGFDGSGSHGRGRLRHFTERQPAVFPNAPHIPENLLLETSVCKWVFREIGRSNGGWRGKVLDGFRRLLRFA